MKPIILITPGDPAGIGAEISVKAVARPEVASCAVPVLISDECVIRDALRITSSTLTPVQLSCAEDAADDPTLLQYIDIGAIRPGEFGYGRVSAPCGDAAFRYVTRAISLLQEHRAAAVATGPLNKEALRLAGHDFAGHTEIFAHFTDTKDYAMLLVSGSMRVIHVTTHVSMREACDLVTRERVLATIRLAARAMAEIGIPNPHIGVAGLNPHASEHGLFGREETEAIAPAVEAAKSDGIRAEGPVPPDTVFCRMMAGEFDIVVAMYHDQGHIPLKLAGFRLGEVSRVNGINTTVGLPVIRTSVDHGTAFDRAGQNRSDEGSMVDSIVLASQMARARARRVMILADDFTGALDSAVRFSAQGVRTRVIPGLSEAEEAADCEALAVNLSTRHLSQDEAYRVTREAVGKCLRLGFGRVYVKTDSGLRGNIGSAIRAAMDEMGGASAAFVPAWPEEGRVLRGGRYWVSGQPVSQSAFARDPLNPVTQDDILSLLDVPCAEQAGECLRGRGRLFIFDAEAPEDLTRAAERIAANGLSSITAGCAGFARLVPDLLDLPRLGGGNAPAAEACLFVSGSVSERNLRQVAASGVPVYSIEESDAARARLSRGESVILAAARNKQEADQLLAAATDAASAEKILAAIADAAANALPEGIACAIAVFGGDTLARVMDRLACRSITPIREIEPGVALSSCDCGRGRLALITKSGNLGSEDVVRKILISACR